MTDPHPYTAWMESLSGFPPYHWQHQLADNSRCRDLLIRVPTGYGKTLGVLAAWAYHRVHRQDQGWPLRLVWMLPMRVLVEQTESEIRRCLTNLGLLWDGGKDHRRKVGVHVLMGGADSGDWHLWPEHAAVLVGTQDMLLSRALNRGYGAGRARWPTDFGLLSQDTLWVLDEVQLMDIGLATAAQLAAFRSSEAARDLRPGATWAMSATLQKGWLEKSPDTQAWVRALGDVTLADADRATPLWTDTTKPLRRLEPQLPRALATEVLATHAALPGDAALTLVVVNTVDRARELYLELRKALGQGGAVKLHLLHSRFRGVERGAWRASILGPDAPRQSRIIVATQVIEAGVDLSADALFTELCPWPSLVQRFGRLARRGGQGSVTVLDLDRTKHAPPYDPDDLEAAWDALGQVTDCAPRSLEAFEASHPDLLPGLYPYDPSHLLLREELDSLFDTTPDLSGADLDISQFIRSGEERDVSVFWLVARRDDRGRAVAPDPSVRAVRAGLCAVPFLAARDWLCGKASKGSEPRYLRKDVDAWVWDYLDGRWRRAIRADLRPGQTILVDHRVGGYSTELGWSPALASGANIPIVDPEAANAQERADAAQDQEELSEASWQTIGFHGSEVARAVGDIARSLASDNRVIKALTLAARWHDLGKAHPAFQGAIVGDDRPVRSDLAKAPGTAWRRGRSMYRLPDGTIRAGFRHELASTLALFDVISRFAAPEHSARLGNLAPLMPDAPPPTSSSAPGTLEQEILGLDPDEFDLVAYLVCSHHGKLRARLHAAPADQLALAPDGSMPIRGVREGDTLPATALAGTDGSVQLLPACRLTLSPAALGLSPTTGRSWVERVTHLLKCHGPFTLAYLEALLRAADVRASRDFDLSDPALSKEVS